MSTSTQMKYKPNHCFYNGKPKRSDEESNFTGDSLFGDLKNQMNLIMAQIKLNKKDEAVKSFGTMLNVMNQWENRLRNGEHWDTKYFRIKK